MQPSHSNTGKWLLGAALVLALGLVLVLTIYAISLTILAGKRADTSAGEVSAPRAVLSTATSLSKPSPGPQGTSTPQLVSLRASATDLSVGDALTITATIHPHPVGGAWGNGYYTVEFMDDAVPSLTHSVPPLRVMRDGRLFAIVDVSKVLKFDSIAAAFAGGVINVTVAFQAVAPGITLVAVGVCGEIGETDGQGRWWFEWACSQSEDLEIRVTE